MRFPALPLYLFLLTGLVACAGERRLPLPDMTATADPSLSGFCAGFFPEGRWQFTHTIVFSLPGGGGSTVLGVTSLDDGKIGCALMTIEGFTLFTAESGADGVLQVLRAVPPFDKPGFAEGLMRDVRMIFLPPPAEKVLSGRLADNNPICRYEGPADRVTDILPQTDGCWRINSFSRREGMDRSLVATSCRRIGGTLIPGKLELHGFSPRAYTLKMTLLKAENLNPEALP